MNIVKVVVNRVRQYRNSPHYKHVALAIGVAAVIGAAGLAYWLPVVQARQSMKEVETAQALKAVQNELAEAERLRSRAISPKLAGTILRETLLTSLSGYADSISVDLVDADHVRVRGTGNFDTIIAWLGDAQPSHHFDVKAMEVSRQNDVASFEMTLSLVQE
jgi:type II secretory pathway component PulM